MHQIIGTKFTIGDSYWNCLISAEFQCPATTPSTNTKADGLASTRLCLNNKPGPLMAVRIITAQQLKKQQRRRLKQPMKRQRQQQEQKQRHRQQEQQQVQVLRWQQERQVVQTSERKQPESKRRAEQQEQLWFSCEDTHCVNVY